MNKMMKSALNGQLLQHCIMKRLIVTLKELACCSIMNIITTEQTGIDGAMAKNNGHELIINNGKKYQNSLPMSTRNF